MNHTDPYGLPEDLRRLISSSRNTNNTHLPTSEPPCLYGGGGVGGGVVGVTFPPPNYCYEPSHPIMVGDVFYPQSHSHHHHHNYGYSSTINPTTTANSDHATASASAAFCVGLETSSIDNNKGWFGNFDSCNNRWPRQETLSLLEIRSRLDSKFRENNQKAPLWNEISRYSIYINSLYFFVLIIITSLAKKNYLFIFGDNFLFLLKMTGYICILVKGYS
jgi:hypothetical protein